MGAIVLFEGVCNFCHASVNFIIDHDPNGYFMFAPLQSETGQQLAAKYGLRSEATNINDKHGNLNAIDSVILVEEGRVFKHSTAALRVARRLSGPWRIFFGFIVVPSFVRDFFYRLFARYRYRFFGKKEACMLPSAEVRARFL